MEKTLRALQEKKLSKISNKMGGNKEEPIMLPKITQEDVSQMVSDNFSDSFK